MLDAANEAIAFLGDRESEDVLENRQFALSPVQLLEIIGEAARGVSPGFRSAHPSLPWRQMIGMRERLIHRYFDIDWVTVCRPVKDDLPSLVEQLEIVLRRETRD